MVGRKLTCYPQDEVKYGHFQHSVASNSKIDCQIWLHFELILELIPVLVICNFDKDPVKHFGAGSRSTFNINKSMGFVFDNEVKVIPRYIFSFSRLRFLYLPSLSINGPRQANLVLIAYASSEGSGEPAHPRSLARTSTARSYKQ